MFSNKVIVVIVLCIAVICVLAIIVISGGFGSGYSSQVTTNVSYADSKGTIPIGLYLEYEVKGGEEKIDYPLQISKENKLTVDYDIQFVEQGDLMLIIRDSSKKERFSLKLTEGKQQKEIQLPKGKYNLEILMKEGIGSGDIKWKGIENESGS